MVIVTASEEVSSGMVERDSLPFEVSEGNACRL